MEALRRNLHFFSEPDFQQEIREHGKLVVLNKGDVVVREGQYVKFLPIVIKGSIRVFQQKEDREMLLYYVRQQETCTMSLAAAYFNNISTSHGVAAEATEALVFPAKLISEWQLKYPSWNRYVMLMFRSRYDELINALEGVVFEHIDVRVMKYLNNAVQKAGSSNVYISHQRLAHELGTTRVVVSRILKQFEREEKVKLFRGCIELV
ncbi:Crp/Fnr family transcriptional regulator [Flammeovirgaceae bacterium 311]|nr:Crp/Fnr family transcriptional regulator [Flammeovirgaceae bacterium 311]